MLSDATTSIMDSFKMTYELSQATVHSEDDYVQEFIKLSEWVVIGKKLSLHWFSQKKKKMLIYRALKINWKFVVFIKMYVKCSEPLRPNVARVCQVFTLPDRGLNNKNKRNASNELLKYC